MSNRRMHYFNERNVSIMPIDQAATSWIVLIVDDEPDNIGVAEKVLRFSGAATYTAENGVEGLKVLESVVPTFILLDISMPIMDGWTMLKHIRQNPDVKHLPVIALTAHAMHGDRERAIEAGFDWYISKPFHVASFMGELKACLAQVETRQNS